MEKRIEMGPEFSDVILLQIVPFMKLDHLKFDNLYEPLQPLQDSYVTFMDRDVNR